MGALFAVLAVTLPRSFFSDYGIAVGPLAWIGCSLLTGRLLQLPLAGLALASAVSGVAAGVVGVAVEHVVSLPIAIVLFGAISARTVPRRRPPAASRARA